MFAAAFAFLTAAAFAEESPVRVEVADVLASAGATIDLPVHLLVPPGAHVYAEMVAIEVVDADGLVAGAVVEPPGKLVADPANPTRQREVYEPGDTVLSLPLTLPEGSPRTYTVKLLVRHQACRDGLCYPAREDALTSTVSVAGIVPVAGIGVAQAAPPEAPAALFTAARSADGTVAVHVDLQGDWHINKMFVGLHVSEPAGYAVGELVMPPATPSGKVEDGTFREDFVADFTVVAPITGPEGPAAVTVDFAYQACEGVKLCRTPTTEAVKVPVVVLPAGQVATLPDPATLVDPAPAAHPPSPVPATAASEDPPPDAFAAAAEKGLLFLLVLCFMAGVAVSFTPCVLPMVPITMAIIGARGATTKFEAFSLALAYTLGQTLVYTGLGVVMGMTGGLFGSQMQNPYLVGGIGVLFVGLSLSMFGFFDIQVPGFIQSRVSGYEKRGGYGVSVVFGMIGGVLAGPCSGPVVIAILSKIATEGQIGLGAVLMAAFSTGMGMIFLVAGVAISAIPKRGAWMALVKKAFGPVLLLMAIFFTKTLFTDLQVALLTAGTLLITGVFAWPDPADDEGFWVSRVRQLYTLVALLVGAWLLIGSLMTSGFLLPRPAAVGAAPTTGTLAPSGPGITWLATEEAGLAASASAGGKPLMIDFTAEWCAACHEMEKLTYTQPGVVAASEGFVTVMIDCTDKADPVVLAVQKKYGVMGLPTVVFVRPDGSVLERTVGFVEAPEFEAVMARAKAKAG